MLNGAGAKGLINQVDEHVGSEASSKAGSANRQNRAASSVSKPGSRTANSANPTKRGASKKFDRVLSSRAIQIGQENGITAEFITK